MTIHIRNRSKVVEALVRELVGPDPRGKELDVAGEVSFADFSEAYNPWCQAESREEILQRDTPRKRYGVGVLYPYGETVETEDDDLFNSDLGAVGLDEEMSSADEPERIDSAGSESKQLDISDSHESDWGVSLANRTRPSSIGLSFLADVAEGTHVEITFSGGRYEQKKIYIAGSERIWWLRIPVQGRAVFRWDEIRGADGRISPSDESQSNAGSLVLSTELYVRRARGAARLITATLVNRTSKSESDQHCLFQTALSVRVRGGDSTPGILPYPAFGGTDDPDPEEQSLALLYRNSRTFAIGHGCAATWADPDSSGRTAGISSQSIPSCETHSITPEIEKSDSTPLEIEMARLAGLNPDLDGLDDLRELVDEYTGWIDARRLEVGQLESGFQRSAAIHLEAAERCAQRMRVGISLLETDAAVAEAFRLANLAILVQQLRDLTPRKVRFDPRSNSLLFSRDLSEPDTERIPSGKGKWRAFQIAFILMSLESSARTGSIDREKVELIWFPTGGGKTEAYLGLAAFTMFLTRLRNPKDVGTAVLMRYTLRLLTAQQFTRAAGLICAMETIRRSRTDLGETPFTIGIWLGGSTTPNTRKQGLEALRALLRGDRDAENPFALKQCPWCGAEIGPISYPGRPPRSAPRIAGLEQRMTTVVICCPDRSCQFGRGLPVRVIDEDIYEARPSLVIGTVDKFAMLAWRPQARSIFGLDQNGRRVASPPGLIIQDELHLISGPLGSMVGLYEALIEELCTDRRGETPIPPKIIASTATIRRYEEQIRALYGRPRATLFPPPGN
jgi:hypothetical protein